LYVNRSHNSMNVNMLKRKIDTTIDNFKNASLKIVDNKK
jgi:hypothetical protein